MIDFTPFCGSASLERHMSGELKNWRGADEACQTKLFLKGDVTKVLKNWFKKKKNKTKNYFLGKVEWS